MLLKIVAKSTRNSSSLNCPKPAQNLPQTRPNLRFCFMKLAHRGTCIQLLCSKLLSLWFSLCQPFVASRVKKSYISAAPFGGKFLVNLNTIGEPQFTALISPQFFECSEKLCTQGRICFSLSKKMLWIVMVTVLSTHPACFKFISRKNLLSQFVFQIIEWIYFSFT